MDNTMYGAFETIGEKPPENAELNEEQQKVADEWAEKMKDAGDFEDRADDGLPGAIANIGEKGNTKNPNGKLQEYPSVTKRIAENMSEQEGEINIDKLSKQAGATIGERTVVTDALRADNPNIDIAENEMNNLKAGDGDEMQKMQNAVAVTAEQAAGAKLASEEVAQRMKYGVADGETGEAEARKLIDNTMRAAESVESVIDSQNVDGQPQIGDRFSSSVRNAVEAATEAQNMLDEAKAQRAAAEEAREKEEEEKRSSAAVNSKEQDDDKKVEVLGASADILNFNAAPQEAERAATERPYSSPAATKEATEAKAPVDDSQNAEVNGTTPNKEAAREQYEQKAA